MNFWLRELKSNAVCKLLTLMSASYAKFLVLPCANPNEARAHGRSVLFQLVVAFFKNRTARGASFAEYQS